MKNKQKVSTFKVAATYIGTVVGAGFATGQEVLQFFGYYGLTGILGLILAGVLFAFYGVIILKLGLKLQAESHLKVIREIGGKWLGSIIDWVITFFLFGALVAMAAGAGALFEEQFGLSPLLGNALMVIITTLTVLFGITGVINAISFVAPFLIASVLGISILSLARIDFNLSALQWSNPSQAAVPFWPFSAIIYVSYNLVMAVAILAPLGKEAENKKVLTKGAIWGGLGLGLGAIAITLAIIANAPEVTRLEVPVAFIASTFSPLVGNLYTGVLLAEVYTTAVGSLYGFAARLSSPKTAKFKLYSIGTAIIAFFASQFGFTNLVRVLFSGVGYIGLLLIAGLTWYVLKPYILAKFAPTRVLNPAYKKLPKENKPDKQEQEKED